MMVTWVFALVLSTSLAVLPNDAELVRLEHIWNEAHLKGDVSALEALWAEGLVVTVPLMPRMNRDTALAVARSGRIQFERYETSAIETRVYGDTAIVTGRLERTRRKGDQLQEDHWQFTKVYLRQDGRWRVIVFDASEAPSQQ